MVLSFANIYMAAIETEIISKSIHASPTSSEKMHQHIGTYNGPKRNWILWLMLAKLPLTPTISPATQARGSCQSKTRRVFQFPSFTNESRVWPDVYTLNHRRGHAK